MKHARLFCSMLTLAAVGGWAVADACEKDKTSQASAASYSTASATHAGCDAKGVSATAASAHGACTAEQAATCQAKGMKATTASKRGGKVSAKTAAMEHCTGMSSTSAAAMDHCAGKATASGASAVTASSNHCGAAKTTSAMAAGQSCGTAKSTTAMAAGAGHACNGQGAAKAAYMSNHHDCDACMDMSGCAEEIGAVGASSQMVPLKNGVMYVYTADSPAKVRAVQTALSRRSERMMAMTTAGEKARLCSECKAMRGAAASGKLNREVVNIEGGCLTLMTSNDPRIVAKIHSMSGVQVASRVKL